MEELYGLDESLMIDLAPIYGFIFLFKWDPSVESKRKKQALEPSEIPKGTFFANQTIQNACATQALLSILLNVPPTAPIELGNDLLNFRDFSQELTPEMRGEAIGSNELIRRVHNSFARPEMALVADTPQKRSTDKEDPFHFVSFLPIGDMLFEFDGLKPAPIPHGQCGDDWTASALKAIAEKIDGIQKSSDDEIRFNLMAVIKDRATHYRECIDHHIRMICQLEDALRLNPPNTPNDPRNEQIQSLLAQNADLEARLEEEQMKSAAYQRENARRRHNFVPLVIALLTEMADTGHLSKFIQK